MSKGTPYQRIPTLSVEVLLDGTYEVGAWFRSRERKFAYAEHKVHVTDLEAFFRRWREDPESVALADFGIDLNAMAPPPRPMSPDEVLDALEHRTP